MTVLTADRVTQIKKGELHGYPMAVVKIYKGSLVCINAAGYVTPATNTAGLSNVIGIADEYVDNSGGAAGDKTMRVRSGIAAKFAATSIAATNVGELMYVVDDQTFHITATQKVVAGLLVKRDSATVGWIWIPPAGHELIPNLLEGTQVGNVAEANVIGGIRVIHEVAITAGVLADTDVILTHKTRVLDAFLILRGAGVATTTLTVKNGATAITNAMAASGSDQDLVRAASINDASYEIAAGGTLRVTSATGASQPAALVVVIGLRVA